MTESGDERRARASAHYDGPMAALYEKARPGYPAEALRWMLGDAPLRVLDLAAGTGKLTRGLVALGHEVTAVEPSEAMRSVLRGEIDSIEVIDGIAEDIPLSDGSVDAIVVGQAYRWFDHMAANREFFRVVRPGGTVGLLFNESDRRVPWVAEMARMLRDAENYDTAEVNARQGVRFEEGFADVETRQFQHGQEMTLSDVLDLVGTRPGVVVLAAEQRELLLDEIAALIHARLPERFTYPYVTPVHRARVK